MKKNLKFHIKILRNQNMYCKLVLIDTTLYEI